MYRKAVDKDELEDVREQEGLRGHLNDLSTYKV